MGEHVAATGVGAILSAVRDGSAQTRADLVTATGLARGTVARRLGQLLDAGLVIPTGDATSTGGRPSETFQLDPHAGSVLVADVGATRARVAISDLLGRVLAEHEELLDVALGPEPILAELHRRWSALVAGLEEPPPAIRGVAVSVPGPVDQETGATVAPPIMTGWDRFPVRDVLAERYGCLAWVDNDVNAMALGEHRAHYRDRPDLLFVKVGTGVGAGLVLENRLYRGAIGAAGDVGHIQLEGIPQRSCRCGMTGCVEAVAGGWALRQQLEEAGLAADSSRAVVELVRHGDPTAIELVRRAGQVLGAAISYAVNLVNPSIVVLGGDLAHAHEHLLAGVRETVYRRSLPLATADLRIVASRLDRRAGIVGDVVLITDRLLDPVRVEERLGAGHDWATPARPAAEVLADEHVAR